MANKDNQKLNHADPTYRYWSRQDENGKVIYSAPMERPEDETVETPVEAEEDRTFKTLRYSDGRQIRVHFVDTDNREAAFMQKRWMDTLHKREQRYEARYTLLKKYGTNEDVDCVWDFSPQMHRNDDGFTRADYSDLPDLVAAFISEHFPENSLYAEVYMLNVREYTPKQIGEELGIDQSMVYYYLKEALKIAQKYRKLYFDEGQYTFPQPFKSKRTRRKADHDGTAASSAGRPSASMPTTSTATAASPAG